MPDMNGFELYRQIKKIDNKAKICFLTGSELYHGEYADIFNTSDGRYFIQKPIENEELISFSLSLLFISLSLFLLFFLPLILFFFVATENNHFYSNTSTCHAKCISFHPGLYQVDQLAKKLKASLVYPHIS